MLFTHQSLDPASPQPASPPVRSRSDLRGAARASPPWGRLRRSQRRPPSQRRPAGKRHGRVAEPGSLIGQGGDLQPGVRLISALLSLAGVDPHGPLHAQPRRAGTRNLRRLASLPRPGGRGAQPGARTAAEADTTNLIGKTRNGYSAAKGLFVPPGWDECRADRWREKGLLRLHPGGEGPTGPASVYYGLTRPTTRPTSSPRRHWTWSARRLDHQPSSSTSVS